MHVRVPGSYSARVESVADNLALKFGCVSDHVGIYVIIEQGKKGQFQTTISIHTMEAVAAGFSLQGSRGPNWTPGIPAGPLICSVGVQYNHHQTIRNYEHKSPLWWCFPPALGAAWRVRMLQKVTSSSLTTPK